MKEALVIVGQTLLGAAAALAVLFFAGYLAAIAWLVIEAGWNAGLHPFR